MAEEMESAVRDVAELAERDAELEHRDALSELSAAHERETAAMGEARRALEAQLVGAYPEPQTPSPNPAYIPHWRHSWWVVQYSPRTPVQTPVHYRDATEVSVSNFQSIDRRQDGSCLWSWTPGLIYPFLFLSSNYNRLGVARCIGEKWEKNGGGKCNYKK